MDTANGAATEKIHDKYPDDQILTGVGNGDTESGFALKIGENKTHGDWNRFQQSVQEKSRLNVNQIKDGVVEYQGVSGKVKLQYQKGLPKVWRNRSFHDWRQHYGVYQNAPGSKTPIYQGWKQGQLEVSAGGYKFTRRRR